MTASRDSASLPVPRPRRAIAPASHALAARAMSALAELDGRVLLFGDAPRRRSALRTALATAGYGPQSVLAERDVARYVGRMADSRYELALVDLDAFAAAGASMEQLAAVARRALDRLPLILVGEDWDRLGAAPMHGGDVFVPGQASARQARTCIADAVALRALFDRRRSPPSAPDPEAAPTSFEPGRPHVLIVEDMPTWRGMQMGYFGGLPCRVESAQDGLEALRLLQAQPEGFDLVWCSDRTPRLDGSDLIRLADGVRTLGLPFVLYSTELDAAAARNAWHVGAWAWAPAQHLTRDVLVDLARRALQLRLARRVPTGSREPGAATRPHG